MSYLAALNLSGTSRTDHVLAVLVRDVLLQAFLAAKQLVALVTFKEFVTLEKMKNEI